MRTSGELWPGGPVELPCRVKLCGEVYRTRGDVRTTRLAYAIGRAATLFPALLDEQGAARVRERLADFDDPLDERELDEASLYLAARLVGLRRGVEGWRAAVRLCAGLIYDWQTAGGMLALRGVNVDAPLWRVAHALFFAYYVDGAEEAKSSAAIQRLFSKLDAEPSWLDAPAIARPVTRARAQASARSLFEQISGRPFPTGDGKKGEASPPRP